MPSWPPVFPLFLSNHVRCVRMNPLTPFLKRAQPVVVAPAGFYSHLQTYMHTYTRTCTHLHTIITHVHTCTAEIKARENKAEVREPRLLVRVRGVCDAISCFCICVMCANVCVCRVQKHGCAWEMTKKEKWEGKKEGRRGGDGERK